MSISMIVVYATVSSGAYLVTADNLTGLFGNPQASMDLLINHGPYAGFTEAQLRQTAKALTMLMVVLFICETLLVFQIRRPNKSLLQTVKDLRRDSNPIMYFFLGLCWAALLARQQHGISHCLRLPWYPCSAS